MPPRQKQHPLPLGPLAPLGPSTMKELKDTLWKAADRLRGSLSANQYKDVVLGLVFIKYVSDAYDERREHIRSELAAEGMDAEQIDGLIDYPEEAMSAVMAANPTLGGTLPRLYNRDNIDQRRLGELIDLFNSARFSRQGTHRARDLMGEVYEYFLSAFASLEGKRGGEFFTPPSVVKVIVEVLEPASGRVYHPCCGSGGMFVQIESSPSTTRAIRKTSPSMARRASRRPGGWRR